MKNEERPKTEKALLEQEQNLGAMRQEVENLQRYLSQSGYFAEEIDGVFGPQTEDALRAFQEAYQLPVTGEFDATTRELIESPQCGMPDQTQSSLAATRWDKNHLFFSFDEVTEDLGLEEIQEAFRAAFAAWSGVCGISFSEDASSADITIRFVTGEHGDGDPFETQSNVLAHAFYPPPNSLAGDIHINDAFVWDVNIPTTIGSQDLVAVAMHEIGHSLGLVHTEERGAVMFRTLFNGRRQLHEEDIERIQSFYPLPTAIAGSVSSVYSPVRSHTEIFARGEDGYLVYFYVEDGQWKRDSESFKVGGKVSDQPMAISAIWSNRRNHSEVFFRGEDGFLRYFYASPGWQCDDQSFRVGGKVDGAISALFANQRNHAEVFYRGEDGYMRYFYASPSWQCDDQSFRVGGKVGGAISAVFAFQRNHAEVFFQGEDGFLRYFYASPGWQCDSDSFKVGGRIDGAISAVYAHNRKHAEVFCRGEDGYLRYFYTSPGWQCDSASFRSGGKVIGAISSLFASQRNHVEVFYHSEDDFLTYFYTAPGWIQDRESFRMGGQLAGDVSAAFSVYRSHAEVVYLGVDGHLHYYYVESRWLHDGGSF